jgi:hypothetical protein
MADTLNIQKHFRVPPRLAEVLLLLAQNDVVTTSMIQDLVTPDAKSTMHRLRDRLTPTGIELQSQYATGYWLSVEDRKKVLDAMKPDDLGLEAE